MGPREVDMLASNLYLAVLLFGLFLSGPTLVRSFAVLTLFTLFMSTYLAGEGRALPARAFGRTASVLLMVTLVTYFIKTLTSSGGL